MRIPIKTVQEIELMRQSGKILAGLISKLIKEVKPGITTLDLEKIAEEYLKKAKAKPAFKGFPSEDKGAEPYPFILCTSLNEQAVHAFPSLRKLKQGDILSIDAGVNFKGYFSDMAITVPVGKISEEALRLIKVNQQALYRGISKIKPGAFLGDVSSAIESWVEKNGFFVLKDLTGHGIGKKLHEPPVIFNYGKPKTGPKLLKGMCLAIEPIISTSTEEIEVLKDDGWTIVTANGCLSSHFEHTILVTESGFEILTSLEDL